MDNESTRPATEKQPGSVHTDQLTPARSLPPAYIVLWVITILSLLFNVVVFRQLVIAKQVGQQAIGDAIATVGNLQNTTLTYTAVIDDTIPLNADLGLDESIPVPINETLPINASINVPVQMGPFGTYNVTLPISGSVPVNTTLQIVIDQPIHVDTTVPVHLEVPIRLAVKDTPLSDTLDDVVLRLEALALQLNRPLLSFGQGSPEPTSEATAAPEPSSTP
jgi:hypothetical protein